MIFDPEYVKEYRLIGFDNKVGALRDSLSIIEGGEIGSGHSMLALFEIVPTEINKGAIKDNFTDGKLAEINLQYQLPGKSKKLEDQYTCSFNYVPFEKLEKTVTFQQQLPCLVPCSQFSVLKNDGLERDCSNGANLLWQRRSVTKGI